MRLRQQSTLPPAMAQICQDAAKWEESYQRAYLALSSRPGGAPQHQLLAAQRAFHDAGRDRRLKEAVHQTPRGEESGFPVCDLAQADDQAQCPDVAAALVEAVRQLSGSIPAALRIPDEKRIIGVTHRKQYYIDCCPALVASSLSVLLNTCFASNAGFRDIVLGLRDGQGRDPWGSTYCGPPSWPPG